MSPVTVSPAQVSPVPARGSAPLHRAFLTLACLALTTLGCSAAEWLAQERATATPTTAIALQATFTPQPAPMQTLVIVTPPADGRPGVIIVPPGMDPDSVLPALPTEPPTPTPAATAASTPTPEIAVAPDNDTSDTGDAVDTDAPIGVVVTPDSPLLPQQPSLGTPLALVPTATPLAPIVPPTAAPIVIPPDTPTPTPTATATATPTPYITVPQGDLISLRIGPDVSYPQVAQLGPDIPVAITGQSIDGEWLEICCISGEAMWVPRAFVTVNNDISQLAATLAGPPPTPTFTPLPTETPLPTPTPTATPWPFERAIGPQFFPSGNQYLTIFVKLFIGTPPLEVPAEGYRLMVQFEGVERPNANAGATSTNAFEFSAPPGFGNRVQYNYKYEWFPPNPANVEGAETGLQLIGTGTWSVYVTDGSGTTLSDVVTFTTTPSNPNREIYIGWIRIR
ncbi:MAG: hypothetical protein WDZ49_11885 [Litorilinea sp.]